MYAPNDNRNVHRMKKEEGGISPVDGVIYYLISVNCVSTQHRKRLLMYLCIEQDFYSLMYTNIFKLSLSFTFRYR